MADIKVEGALSAEADEATLDTKSAEAQRQVWLVKIPTDVYEVWKNAEETDCIATVRLYES